MRGVLRRMNIKRIAGKTYDEILSMSCKMRHRWYKKILPKEKEEAMKIVELARRVRMSGKNNPMYDRMCGDNNIAKRPEVRAKISASKIGKNNHMHGKTGKSNPNWKGGPVKYICKTCGNIFFRRRGGKLVYQFCSKSCKSKYYKGVLSSNWQGGISFEPYGPEFNNELKEQIRKHDGYICQECGITQEKLGQKLDVHHIDYDKMNNKPENLICLCSSDHARTNFNREYWIEYFKGKRK